MKSDPCGTRTVYEKMVLELGVTVNMKLPVTRVRLAISIPGILRLCL